jgi:hypothetical protein
LWSWRCRRLGRLLRWDRLVRIEIMCGYVGCLLLIIDRKSFRWKHNDSLIECNITRSMYSHIRNDCKMCRLLVSGSTLAQWLSRAISTRESIQCQLEDVSVARPTLFLVETWSTAIP